MSGFGTRAAAPTMSSQQRAAALADRTREPGALRLNDRAQTYPRVAFAPDPRDTDMLLKSELIAGGVQPIINVGQPEIDFAKSKYAQAQELQKDIWISQLYDLTDPATNAYVQKLLPNFHARQQAYFDNAMGAAYRFTRINMAGPQSEEDLDWMYLVKTGEIHVPSGFMPDELMKPLAGTGPYASNSGEFTVAGRGLLNPRRILERLGDATLPTLGYDPNNQINKWATPAGAKDMNTQQKAGYAAPATLLGSRPAGYGASNAFGALFPGIGGYQNRYPKVE